MSAGTVDSLDREVHLLVLLVFCLREFHQVLHHILISRQRRFIAPSVYEFASDLILARRLAFYLN
jgi:hypothetical protein